MEPQAFPVINRIAVHVLESLAEYEPFLGEVHSRVKADAGYHNLERMCKELDEDPDTNDTYWSIWWIYHTEVLKEVLAEVERNAFEGLPIPTTK